MERGPPRVSVVLEVCVVLQEVNSRVESHEDRALSSGCARVTERWRRGRGQESSRAESRGRVDSGEWCTKGRVGGSVHGWRIMRGRSVVSLSGRVLDVSGPLGRRITGSYRRITGSTAGVPGRTARGSRERVRN